jgi:eukaryotic-like serine/threonine-protein kinase
MAELTPDRWQKVKKALAAALERPPEERRVYLEQACPEPALRREVESLIAAHEQGDTTLMDRPFVGSNETLKAGAKLGPYEILAPLGAGGMGVVYRARDGRLERDVAIKVLSLGLLTDEAARKRFRKEALALAKLNHPNIAAVYDVGEEKGTDYLVMECVPGQSLAEEAGSRPVPEKEAVALGTQIATALEEAHEQGIVHRDLKPGNIMVTPKRQAKVLDFGLARILRPSGEASATESLTQTQNLAGTLPYMAPEQLRGEPADARTDIHALGAVLFEVVTGKRLYHEDSVPQLTDAILHRQPVPPRALNARVSPELERIILKCLEKERENRYQSAKEIGVDLRRLSAPSSVTPTAAARPASRRRMVLPVAGALVIGLGLGVGGYLYLHRTPKLTEKDSIVLADFTNTTGDPVFDGTLRQGLSVQLEQTPFLQLVSDDRVGQTLRLMEKPPDTRLTRDVAREVCQRANATAEIEGSIAALGNQYVLGLNAVSCGTGETLAGEQVTAGGKENVLAALTTAASELRSKLGESPTSLEKFDAPLEQATTGSLEALQNYTAGFEDLNHGRFLAARPLLERAIALDPNFAMAYFYLSIAFNNAGDIGREAEYKRKAFELIDRVSEYERDLITAGYYESTGELDKANDADRLGIANYPRAWGFHNGLSDALINLGQYEEGLREGQAAAQLQPNAEPPYRRLLDAYMCLDRLDEAKKVAERVRMQGIDGARIHQRFLEMAYIEGDQAAVARETLWYAGKPEEYLSFGLQAANLNVHGQRRDSGKLYKRAAETALRLGLRDVAADFEEADARADMLSNNCRTVRNLGRPALALAMCGDAARAEKLAGETSKLFPNGTLWNAVQLPETRAAIELQRNQPAKAVELLASASPYERAYPEAVYLRGLAYLRLRKGVEAAAEFQKILDHKGASWGSTWRYPNWGLYYSISYLGLARASELAGDAAKAKRAFQDFFALWKDADPDIPILKQAKAEYAKLQ